jgi:hypothetical protein
LELARHDPAVRSFADELLLERFVDALRTGVWCEREQRKDAKHHGQCSAAELGGERRGSFPERRSELSYQAAARKPARAGGGFETPEQTTHRLS